MENEIIKALKEDRLYGFIANNYYKIDREITKDLILEIYYILRMEVADEDINGKIIEYLQGNRDWEE